MVQAGDIPHWLGEIHRLFEGSGDAPSQALDLMMAAVRSNQPYLFPKDSGAFTPRVQKARANVRTLAVLAAGLSIETIEKSQRTFLGQPAMQLIA